jgi:hypothetical protein
VSLEADRTSTVARANFILGEAAKLGIKVGTDGEDLVVAIPLRLPREVRASFEAAAEACRDALIEHILHENEVRP